MDYLDNLKQRVSYDDVAEMIKNRFNDESYAVILPNNKIISLYSLGGIKLGLVFNIWHREPNAKHVTMFTYEISEMLESERIAWAEEIKEKT